MSPFSSVSFLAPATGLLAVQEAIWGTVPTPCMYLRTWDPPQPRHRQGLGRTPEVIWPTPLSPAKTSCQGPGGVGQEVHLPLGMSFLLWVKEDPPFG